MITTDVLLIRKYWKTSKILQRKVYSALSLWKLVLRNIRNNSTGTTEASQDVTSKKIFGGKEILDYLKSRKPHRRYRIDRNKRDTWNDQHHYEISEKWSKGII